MGTARRTAIATLVAGGIIVLALALWKLRLVVALLFFAIIIASAMRPSIDWLARHRIPRPAGLALHYLALLGAIAVAIAFATPRALDQVNHALSPSGKAEIAREAKQSTGIKHDVLTAAPETTEAPAQALGAREAGDADRPQGVRGRDRDLLHARSRRLLDLRAGQDGRRRLLADPETEAQAGARHVDADRPAARRVRARAGAPDHARSGSCSRCSSGRSACRTGSWSARSPAWSRSSP